MSINPINTVAHIPHTATEATSGQTPWQRLLRICRAWEAFIVATPNAFPTYDPLPAIQRNLHQFEQIPLQITHLPLFRKVALLSDHEPLAMQIAAHFDITKWLPHELTWIIFEYHNPSPEEHYQEHYQTTLDQGVYPTGPFAMTTQTEQDCEVSFIKTKIKHGYYGASEKTSTTRAVTGKQTTSPPMIPEGDAFSIFQETLLDANAKAARYYRTIANWHIRPPQSDLQLIISEVHERVNQLSRFAIPAFAPEHNAWWREMSFLLGDAPRYVTQLLPPLLSTEGGCEPALVTLIVEYYGNGRILENRAELNRELGMETYRPLAYLPKTYLPHTREWRDQRFGTLLAHLQTHYRRANGEPELFA